MAVAVAVAVGGGAVGAQEPHAVGASAADQRMLIATPEAAIEDRPALLQQIQLVSEGVQEASHSMAVLGSECPDGWVARRSKAGKILYVPLGLLVDDTGTPQTTYTLLVACTKER